MRNNIIGILMISALASAAHAAPPTVLTDCGLLSLPGRYILANDVVTPALGVCFLVNGAEVNLNMDGHSINLGPANPGVIPIGIRVTAAGAGARIHDGSIAGLLTASNAGTGIRIESVSGVRVTGMTITGNHIGLHIIQADDNRFDGNNVSSNSHFGFQVDSGSDNNSFVGNQCDQNGWSEPFQ